MHALSTTTPALDPTDVPTRERGTALGGRTLRVAARRRRDARYRFRLLNASNSRFYQLELRDQDGTPLAGVMQQIGTGSGLLPAPLPLDRLVLAPAERADARPGGGSGRSSGSETTKPRGASSPTISPTGWDAGTRRSATPTAG
jgi:FtsP/CotA-like multicopper oxidase with cupredoxin domain